MTPTKSQYACYPDLNQWGTKVEHLGKPRKDASKNMEAHKVWIQCPPKLIYWAKVFDFSYLVTIYIYFLPPGQNLQLLTFEKIFHVFHSLKMHCFPPTWEWITAQLWRIKNFCSSGKQNQYCAYIAKQKKKCHKRQMESILHWGLLVITTDDLQIRGILLWVEPRLFSSWQY